MDTNQIGEYSFGKKLSAFAYHVGMTLFGEIICPDKYRDYKLAFDAFVAMKRNEEKKESEGSTQGEDDAKNY